VASRKRAHALTKPVKPENPLPLPPTHVLIPWQLADDIEVLLRTMGFFYQADKLRTYITAAEQAARP
jgi:hypothetical protein